ncbi:MAG: (p)ppGpp synthetase [Candidatus Marinimicrobia bacterium]|nr:(p)ppGpp synthetase [Candidatus Neomarinimicrobiota bacterium]|tara:strand:- start:6371 stop:8578 length:2208 start_codon:yes stop_codon:yes gene_type:complete
MVLELLKKYLSNKNLQYPLGFRKILKSFPDNYILNDDNIDFIWKAYQFGESAHKGQKRKSGDPYFNHCIEVCIQLIKWNMDIDTIVSGLLHDTIEDTAVTKRDLKIKFNTDVSQLVFGVSKLSGIRFKDNKHRQAENLMKMFLSVAKDLRVIIIKFSDRLHNMKTLKYLPIKKQHRIAIETRDLYAPLAHRLGMNELKMNYENLILKAIEPEIYIDIKKKVNATNKKGQSLIDEFSKPINNQLNKFEIESLIKGRAKHYYSIYRKMKFNSKKFNELFDLLGIRIIVNKIEECYAVLGIIHQLYTPLQERFKDYIATPKSNGYQSIHTTVFGIKGKIFEVQIRTKEMDQLAEVGIAAHWIYKERPNQELNPKTKIDDYVKWLRNLVDVIQSEDRDPNELLELLKIDLFQDEIFVFTPNGDVHQLKKGSTPIDFAFSIHSQIGLKCSGAKINGKIAQLNSELKNGDTVEIITSSNQSPNQAWLKIVKTTKAIAHIKRVIKKDQENKSIELGREILEKFLRKIKKLNLLKEIENNPEKMGYNNIKIIYSNIAKGKYSVKDILEKYEIIVEDEKLDIHYDNDTLTEKFIRRARGVAKGVIVDGISNAMIAFPKCCNPVPGDEIVGYITKGKGVSVHRVKCNNLNISDDKSRFIEVQWDVNNKNPFLVRLKIVFEDRKHLLKDLTESTSSLNINLKSVDISALDGVATCLMILEVSNIKELKRLQDKIITSISPIKIERV